MILSISRTRCAQLCSAANARRSEISSGGYEYGLGDSTYADDVLQRKAFLQRKSAYDVQIQNYDAQIASAQAWRAVFMAMGTFWIVIATLSFAFFVMTTNPLIWVISHLILDPQTGYFRMRIWDAASNYIALAPVTGYAYEFHKDILDGALIPVGYSIRCGLVSNVHFVLSDKCSGILPEQTGIQKRDQ
jgi:hypothetical protein